MTQLTVIARLKAKPGQEAALEKLLVGLIGPTRVEAGCIAYDLHRSHEDPGLFIFTESWESRALWEDHMKAPHLTEFGRVQGDVTESWELFVGERIG